MKTFPEGNAIVYCEGAFGTTNGKTAHGLVRRTERYKVLSVIDSKQAGSDALAILDNREAGIPIYTNIGEAVMAANLTGTHATHLIMGLAPDGGRLAPRNREDIIEALEIGLHVDSGLHDFLSEDPEMSSIAKKKGLIIRDIRKPLPRKRLHFFTGKIEDVACLKVAVLGTDSAIGKRTTSWLLIDALRSAGLKAEMIGTGQTAWMQGARFCIILDSIINDFVSGEVEHAVWSAWNEVSPDIIVIEGQGSLMNPAYPGGFEILAAGRPDIVILQHAPARNEYDGFPGYPLHPIEKQIQAIEVISEKPVVGIAINHEGLTKKETAEQCREIEKSTGLPVHDPLLDGGKGLAEIVSSFLNGR